MEKLYIIGNGFDLHHDLPTRYQDFHQYVIDNFTDLENAFEDYFSLTAGEDGLWSKFEEDLGSFNWRSYFNDYNHLDINDDNFKPSSVFCLEDSLIQEVREFYSNIQEAFHQWLEGVDVSNATQKIEFFPDSFFLSFNYTLLLEEVYQIDPERILHLHGDISMTSDDLIFGHNVKISESVELDEKGDSNRTMFTDSEESVKIFISHLRKPVERVLDGAADKFALFSGIKDIYIIGHSLNMTDMPYFEEIKKKVHSPTWNVSYYDECEKERHLLVLYQIGVKEGSINLFKLQ